MTKKEVDLMIEDARKGAYAKGQYDMTNAIRKAVDKKKEDLPKGAMKVGMMIAHNIINDTYGEQTGKPNRRKVYV